MRMGADNVEDIRRVLAICFRMGNALSSDELERILSFDMGWMDTDTAHDAIKALAFAGWLKNVDEMLEPNCDIKGVAAPLGWQPRPSRLTEPVVNEESAPSKAVKAQVIQKQQSIVDPREKLESRLAKFIARKAGLTSEEVMRRANRKTKALRHCTIWLALCLISREQGLEMDPIIDSLATV